MKSPRLPTGSGELIVRSGERAGRSLPLRQPVTVVGAADGCDVRLESEGVSPVHCLIAITATGPVLRSWVPGSTLVNGHRRTEAALNDGDEIGVGPWVFQVTWAPLPDPTRPDSESEPTTATIARRQRQLDTRERHLAEARGQFREQCRKERDAIADTKKQADELLAEAAANRHLAAAERARARALAGRYLRRVNRQWITARKQLNDERLELESRRQDLAGAAAKLRTAWESHQTQSTADKERLRDAWGVLEAGQRRAAEEWDRSNAYFRDQQAALEARTREIADREHALNRRMGRADRELSLLKNEAAALDARTIQARRILEELDRGRQSHLHETAPAPVAVTDRIPLHHREDVAGWAIELAEWEARLKAEQAGLRTGTEQATAQLTDRRMLLAEQFGDLIQARVRWLRVECGTLDELEQLAGRLRAREEDLTAREATLLQRDVRRREEAFELWQLRLKYEAWQTKLFTAEARLADYRDQAARELERRTTELLDRERNLLALAEDWDRLRSEELARLRSEIEFWAEDRQRLRRHEAALLPVETAADRALVGQAAEGLALLQQGAERGLPTADRRFRILRRRWGRVFDRRAKEIEERRSALTDESARIERRLGDLQARLLRIAAGTELTSRSHKRVKQLSSAAPEANVLPPLDPSVLAELSVLRAEVERLAYVLIETDIPEQTDMTSSPAEPGDGGIRIFVPPAQAA